MGYLNSGQMFLPLPLESRWYNYALFNLRLDPFVGLNLHGDYQ